MSLPSHSQKAFLFVGQSDHRVSNAKDCRAPRQAIAPRAGHFLRVQDKNLRRLGRAELPLCPEFLGGSRFRIGTPYRRHEEFCPARESILCSILNLRRQVRGIEAKARFPLPKTTVRVDGFHPFIEVTALCFIFWRHFPFRFHDQHGAADQSDQVVGAVFVEDAREDVGNLKTQVIVLRPGCHPRIMIEFVCGLRFPCRIGHAQIDMGPV